MFQESFEKPFSQFPAVTLNLISNRNGSKVSVDSHSLHIKKNYKIPETESRSKTHVVSVHVCFGYASEWLPHFQCLQCDVKVKVTTGTMKRIIVKTGFGVTYMYSNIGS